MKAARAFSPQKKSSALPPRSGYLHARDERHGRCKGAAQNGRRLPSGFTTTSTDHALEGFQVRALHYLVKPFSEEELSALLAEMLARLPRPEPVLTVKVSGSDVRLCYRDIISAEHFAHLINIRTTALKTLVTRQSFKVFTEPLKKDPRFFVCGRGMIVNLEHAADFGTVPSA